MPLKDGTGPFGTGPVGRRLGPCSGSEQEYDQQFGLGMAHRRGRRFGNRYLRWGGRPAPAFREEESEMVWLQNRQNWLKEQLDAVTHEIERRNTPSE